MAPAFDGTAVTPCPPAVMSETPRFRNETVPTPDGLLVHSLATLLADIGALTLKGTLLPGRPDSRFRPASEPTGLQAKAFGLLGTDLDRDVCMSVTA